MIVFALVFFFLMKTFFPYIVYFLYALYLLILEKNDLYGGKNNIYKILSM